MSVLPANPPPAQAPLLQMDSESMPRPSPTITIPLPLQSTTDSFNRPARLSLHPVRSSSLSAGSPAPTSRPLPGFLPPKPFKAVNTRRDLTTSFKALHASWAALDKAPVMKASCARLADRAVEVVVGVMQHLEKIERGGTSAGGPANGNGSKTYEFVGRTGSDTMFKLQAILIDIQSFSSDFTSTRDLLSLLVFNLPSITNTLTSLTKSLSSATTFYSLSLSTANWCAEDTLDLSADYSSLPRLFRIAIALRGECWESFLREHPSPAPETTPHSRRDDFIEWCFEKNPKLRPKEGEETVRVWSPSSSPTMNELGLPMSPSSPAGFGGSYSRLSRSSSAVLVPYAYGPSGSRRSSSSSAISSLASGTASPSSSPTSAFEKHSSLPATYQVQLPVHIPKDLDLSSTPMVPSSSAASADSFDSTTSSSQLSSLSMSATLSTDTTLTIPNDLDVELEVELSSPKLDGAHGDEETELVSPLTFVTTATSSGEDYCDAVSLVEKDFLDKVDELHSQKEREEIVPVVDVVVSLEEHQIPITDEDDTTTPPAVAPTPPTFLSPTEEPLKPSPPATPTLTPSNGVLPASETLPTIQIPPPSPLILDTTFAPTPNSDDWSRIEVLPATPITSSPPEPLSESPSSQNPKRLSLSLVPHPIVTVRSPTPTNGDSRPPSIHLYNPELDALPAPRSSIRILCLDGGGIRGLTLLLTLRAALNSTTPEADGSQIRPSDQFDLITGVGTGGLVALLLGRLRLSIDDAIDVYKAIASEAFLGKCSRRVDASGKGRSRWSRLFGGGGSSENREMMKEGRDGILESLLSRYLPEEAMAQLELGANNFTRTHKVKTAILGFRNPSGKEGSRSHWFRSYSYDEEQSPSLTIKDVARATLASSPFFKPYSPSSSSSRSLAYYGEPNKNSLNPSEATLEEARRVWGKDVGIACFLSVGVGKVVGSSGSGGDKASKSKTRAKSMKVVVKLAEEAEGEAARFRAKANREGWEDELLRYNVNLPPSADSGIDEWLNPMLSSEVDQWMRTSHSFGSSSPLRRGLSKDNLLTPVIISNRNSRANKAAAARNGDDERRPLRTSISLGNVSSGYYLHDSGSTGSLV